MRAYRRTIVALVGLAGVLAGPAGGTADPAAIRVALQEEACRRLVAHVPDPDVAYRPGFDAHGNAVAPADLDDPAGGAWLRPLVVPLTLDLGQFADLPAAVDADIPLFDVTVDALGRVRIDGRPLDDRTTALLAAACRAGAE